MPRNARENPARMATANRALARIIMTALATLSNHRACNNESSAMKPEVPGNPTPDRTDITETSKSGLSATVAS